MKTIEEDLSKETIGGDSAAEAAGSDDAALPKKNARTQWNWAQLSGRIASDVEKRQFKEQTVLTFTLVFDTQRKTDKEGSHTNFIQVEIWGKMADLYATILTKGIEVIVTGELFQQRWVAKDGKAAQKYIISTQAIAVSDQTYRPN